MEPWEEKLGLIATGESPAVLFDREFAQAALVEIRRLRDRDVPEQPELEPVSMLDDLRRRVAALEEQALIRTPLPAPVVPYDRPFWYGPIPPLPQTWCAHPAAGPPLARRQPDDADGGVK